MKCVEHIDHRFQNSLPAESRAGKTGGRLQHSCDVDQLLSHSVVRARIPGEIQSTCACRD